MSAQAWRAADAEAAAGRREEHRALAGFLNTVRGGEARSLVLRGEPGMGKTVLLDELAAMAAGRFRVVRVTGVQSEMELAFAGLHQLCAPLLDRIDGLAAPRREALRIAFGLSEGPPPDRFLVGLAVLGLLSEAASDRPLLCVVDDQQWLDRASAQAIGFAARRLAGRPVPVGLVFATRSADEELEGLPELPIAGLSDEDARHLLESALNAPLDPRVRDQIIAETRGNPLALLELPRGLTPAQLAGGFGLPAAVPLSSRIEESFGRRLEDLPEESRRLLQLAAAEPSGDLSLLLRAGAGLGVSMAAAAAAEEAQLARFGARVRFRHPLLRSAAYRSASAAERQAIHLALAAATDPALDPDRRAWHRAQAAAGPDEEVAADLEASAGRARARGGLPAAAAFLERAALLSVDPGRRAERLLAAAQTALQAGAFDAVPDLLAVAQAGVLTELQTARVALIRAQLGFARGRIGEAPSLLFDSARTLEPLDLDLARETYLTAWMAASFAGRLATGADLLEVSRAARRLAPPEPSADKASLLLDALSALVTDEPSDALPGLRKAVEALTTAAGELTADEELRWAWFVQAAIAPLWDFEPWHEALTRQVRAAREAGALDRLPVLLAALGTATVRAGDFAAATELIAESDMYCDATGTRVAPFIAVLLTGLRGAAHGGPRGAARATATATATADQDTAIELIEAAAAEAVAEGQGNAAAQANWAAAILCNGLGRYEAAFAAACEAANDSPGLYASLWALPELIEAAARCANADPEAAAQALAALARSTQAAGTDFALGVEARSRALLAEGEEAERWYREAIARLERTKLRPDLARAHLVFGEWLRRENRRTEARAELRTAYESLSELGCAAFADRAQRELLATGERVRKRTSDPADTALTAQEAAIARLARKGRTNPEIAAQLFISARTVEWHLRKVFGKLGITSRRELDKALDRLGLDDQDPGAA